MVRVLSSPWLRDQLASLPGYDASRCGEPVATGGGQPARPARSRVLPLLARAGGLAAAGPTPWMNTLGARRGRAGHDGGMKLLVLGGTHHVGRAVVEVALARGDQVTTLTGASAGRRPRAPRNGTPTGPTRPSCARRWATTPGTRSSTPGAARRGSCSDSARLLAGRAGHYGYVSSRSVHQWPIPAGVDESAPVVDGDAASDAGDGLRGGQARRRAGRDGGVRRPGAAGQGRADPRPVRAGRPDALVAAADRARRRRARARARRPAAAVHRLPRPGRLDADAADRGLGGAFNTVSQPGHATMAQPAGRPR